MIAEKLGELEALAKKQIDTSIRLSRLGRADGDYHTKEHDIAADEFHKVYAKFRSATDPQTVLSLIATIRAQEAEIAKLREHLRECLTMMDRHTWMSRDKPKIDAARAQLPQGEAE